MELLELNDNNTETVLEHVAVKKVTDFLKTHNVFEEQKGIHEITDDFFYNVIEMETTLDEHRPWESHKKFYDIHYMLSGEEIIKFNFLSNMELGDYCEANDWQKMLGSSLFGIKFKENMLLFLEPNDAHKTGLYNENSSKIRKIVFKVKI